MFIVKEEVVYILVLLATFYLGKSEVKFGLHVTIDAKCSQYKPMSNKYISKLPNNE